MTQVTSVTSESLQNTFRRLLPSQSGFGEDLQATNLITPIIDLTPTAEGSVLPTSLQQALAFGSQTAFDISNTTTTIASTGGFWRIFGNGHVIKGGSCDGQFTLDDGATTKVIWDIDGTSKSTSDLNYLQYDFIVFLAIGISLKGVSNDAACTLIGSVRQLADISGNLVNPSGFTSE